MDIVHQISRWWHWLSHCWVAGVDVPRGIGPCARVCSIRDAIALPRIDLRRLCCANMVEVATGAEREGFDDSIETMDSRVNEEDDKSWNQR